MDRFTKWLSIVASIVSLVVIAAPYVPGALRTWQRLLPQPRTDVVYRPDPADRQIHFYSGYLGWAQWRAEHHR